MDQRVVADTMAIVPPPSVLAHSMQTVSIRGVSPTSVVSPMSSGAEAAATVFVGVAAPESAVNCESRLLPEVHQQQQQRQSLNAHHRTNGNQQPSHVVKIQINPDNSGEVISTVRLTLNDDTSLDRYSSSNRLNVNVENGSAVRSDTCVRISVLNNNNNNVVEEDSLVTSEEKRQMDDLVDSSSDNANGTASSGSCFYYNNGYHHQSSQPIMIMSSGQSSPSETLDSGTCSDLDGTPPPLPKKKSSTVLLGSNGTHHHQRTGSMTSSGAEVDSDDNESNISCDSLNGRELAARILITSGSSAKVTIAKGQSVNGHSGVVSESSASARSTIKSPESSCQNGGRLPVIDVRECTYEERKLESIGISKREEICNQVVGSKYVYEDDRFYNFHLNERDDPESSAGGCEGNGDNEEDEYFAGCKTADRETICSAKGTIRGVKNRVRAGIATFLQNPAVKVCYCFYFLRVFIF